GARAGSPRFVRCACDAGRRDSATAVGPRVGERPEGGVADALRRGRQLPVPARLRVGDRLDGFHITALVSENGVHRLFQARDLESRHLVAIKTLHPGRASDAEERAMLAHEAWLAGRVTERAWQGFVRLREVAEPTAFYLVFDWHSGQTLAQRLEHERGGRGNRSGVAEVVA